MLSNAREWRARRGKPRTAKRRGHVAELPTHIIVRGARQHNLKGVDVEIPRDQMTVCCGPSGSGKSSLAMDTIYAEGQRRYVESLSAYARQFVGQMQKPRVEHIEGLSPAIAIEQKNLGHTPRSTVGTVTEIYDYLRILLARLGQLHCPECDIPVGTQTADEIVDAILAEPAGTKLYLMAPVEIDVGEQYDGAVGRAAGDRLQPRAGRRRDARARRRRRTIDRRRKHEVEVVVDRVDRASPRPARGSPTASRTPWRSAKACCTSPAPTTTCPSTAGETIVHSQHLACDQCGRSFEPLTPHSFSFNSSLGWCTTCEGLGMQIGANPAALLRDPKLTLAEGARRSVAEPAAAACSPAMLDALSAAAPACRSTCRSSSSRPGSGGSMLYGDGRGVDRGRMPQPAKRKQRPSSAAVPLSIQRPLPRPRRSRRGSSPALARASWSTWSTRSNARPAAAAACATTPRPCGSAARRSTSSAACRWASCSRRSTTGSSTGREQEDRRRAAPRDHGPRCSSCSTWASSTSRSSRPARRRSPAARRSGFAWPARSAAACAACCTCSTSRRSACTRATTRRLLAALHKLRDLGNTLLVVEHDREVIADADQRARLRPRRRPPRRPDRRPTARPTSVGKATRQRDRAVSERQEGDRGADEPADCRVRSRGVRKSESGKRQSKAAKSASLNPATPHSALRHSDHRNPRRPPQQPQEHQRRTSRSARSPPSPASAAAARARWSKTCSTARSPASCTGRRSCPASTTRSAASSRSTR